MPANVWVLGVTSLLTDISTEMVASALPLIFVVHLHASPALLAAADGIQQGAASAARLVGGFIADRVHRYRETAVAGYLASALCRIGFLMSVVPAHFLLFLSLDRLGKGFRTGPRDALLARSAPPGEEARAFGLHRSLDTAGAMLGPLVGYWALAVVPGDYSIVFVVSLGFAALGVLVLATCSTNAAELRPRERTSIAEFVAMSRVRPLRKLALVAALLGCATLGDHVVYLMLQRQHGFDLSQLPLLYIATPAACMCLAYPLGWLADRWSRRGVLIGGQALLLAAYLAAVTPMPTWCGVTLVIFALAVHYSATDGVFAALASRSVPTLTKASGLSLLGTVNGLSRLASGLGFGLLWSVVSDLGAILTFSAFAAVCLWGCFVLLSHTERLREELGSE